MAKITKRVSKLIPAGQTYQIFTRADAGSGDILMVKDSLNGRYATHVEIQATSAVYVQLNTVQTVYPRRSQEDGFSDQGLPNISKGVEYTLSGEAPVLIVSTGQTLTLDDDISVSDIRLHTVSGLFSILVS